LATLSASVDAIILQAARRLYREEMAAAERFQDGCDDCARVPVVDLGIGPLLAASGFGPANPKRGRATTPHAAAACRRGGKLRILPASPRQERAEDG
jgi:hypothetical protein